MAFPRSTASWAATPSLRAKAPWAIGLGAAIALGAIALIGPRAPSVLADDAGAMAFAISEGMRNAVSRAVPSYRAASTSYYARAEPAQFQRQQPAIRRASVRTRAQARIKQQWRQAGVQLSAAGGPLAINRRSVCVRLCDGYFFPVGAYSGEDMRKAHEATCESACPGAPTRLYVVPSGSDKLEHAVSARDGKPYSLLPVAFRHTKTADRTCSCNPGGEIAARPRSLMNDFSLRSGDAIMTGTGFRVFRGADHYPYTSSDFMALASSRDTPHRGALAAIERATIPRRAIQARVKKQSAQSAPAQSAPANVSAANEPRPVRIVAPML